MKKEKEEDENEEEEEEQEEIEEVDEEEEEKEEEKKEKLEEEVNKDDDLAISTQVPTSCNRVADFKFWFPVRISLWIF